MVCNSRIFKTGIYLALLTGLGVSAASCWSEPMAATTPLSQQPSYFKTVAPTQWLRQVRDPRLILALQWMDLTEEGRSSLKHLHQKRLKLLFRDLSDFGPVIAQFDAIAWMNKEGDIALFIHQKHQGAPPQALAALIAHEALHDDASNSKAEERFAWECEGKVWQQLQQTLSPQQRLGGNSLASRLNKIVETLQAQKLDALVRDNNAYKGLPEASPGYESLLP
jgi:uncharacterized protein YqcC (DUF446 family)